MHQQKTMLTFNRNYFFLTILIFILEVIIALYVHDKIVRPYLGDSLVVILIYCFIKSFLNLPVVTATVAVLAFSFVIETLQYLNLISLLHLENSKIAKIVLGSSFSWLDMFAYILGAVLILIFEKVTVLYNVRDAKEIKTNVK